MTQHAIRERERGSSRSHVMRGWLAGVLLCTLAGCGTSEVPVAAPPAPFPGVPSPTPLFLSTATPISPSEDHGGGPGWRCVTDDDCEASFCVGSVCCETASCPVGERCDIAGSEGACRPPNPNGDICYRGEDCLSGFCVDAACCAVPACAVGESCRVAGHAGDCTALPTPTASATRRPTSTPTPLPPQPVLRAGSASGDPGQRIAFSVALDTQGASIAGVQNDLSFDSARIPIAAREDGTPDCSVEPSIHKEATAFAFLPNGCTGTACTGLRAIVVATDNVDPLPDGATLYRCAVAIAADAPDGVYPLAVHNVHMSDPRGRLIRTATGSGGQVFVGDVPLPETAAIVLHVDSASPGTRTTLTATLHTRGASVAATQNDIRFALRTAIVAGPNGQPDCAVNPDIAKAGTAFAFQPWACTATSCVLRALVLALDNTDPIPDGSVLYTCRVDVSADAADAYAFDMIEVIMSTPQGEQVPGATGVGAVLTVGG